MAKMDGLDRIAVTSADIEDCLLLMNDLLTKCKSRDDAAVLQEAPKVIVILFERIMGVRLPEIIRSPKTFTENAHNCQAIIDRISQEVLRKDMGHISGESVALGDTTSIIDLLEILNHIINIRMVDKRRKIADTKKSTTRRVSASSSSYSDSSDSEDDRRARRHEGVSRKPAAKVSYAKEVDIHRRRSHSDSDYSTSDSESYSSSSGSSRSSSSSHSSRSSSPSPHKYRGERRPRRSLTESPSFSEGSGSDTDSDAERERREREILRRNLRASRTVLLRELERKSGTASVTSVKPASSAKTGSPARLTRSPAATKDRDAVEAERVFPYLDVSDETIRKIVKRHSAEVLDSLRHERTRKNKKENEVDAAKQRQEALVSLMRKEAESTRRKHEKELLDKERRSIKSTERDERQKSVKLQKYADDYVLQHRSRMSAKTSREEMIFKRMLEDLLEVQKNRIREVRQESKEKKDKHEKEKKASLEALEKFYRDQYAILSEVLGQERREVDIQDKAKAEALRKMRRELKERMEGEIRKLQDKFFNADDAAHFRQKDADRVRHSVFPKHFPKY
eukprot:Opistho-2@26984